VPRGEPSTADKILAEEVRLIGAPWTSARQVQKIREEYRLISSSRRFLGRGLGSESSYPSDTTLFVARLQQLIRMLHSVRLATILLFLEGYDVPEAPLRQVLADLTDSLTQPPEGDPWKAQEDAAEEVKRNRSDGATTFRRVARGHGADPGQAMADLVGLRHGETFHSLTDEPVTQDVPEILKAIGLEGNWASDPEGTADILDASLQYIHSLQAISQTATWSELANARSLAVEDLAIPLGDAIEQLRPRERRSFAEGVVGLFILKLVMGVGRETAGTQG
jgi:hypothetical protein